MENKWKVTEIIAKRHLTKGFAVQLLQTSRLAVALSESEVHPLAM